MSRLSNEKYIDDTIVEDMMGNKPEDLEIAYKKEKDSKVKLKLLAIMLVLNDDMKVSKAARTMRCSPMSINTWIAKFRYFGIDGLRDPVWTRSGRIKKNLTR